MMKSETSMQSEDQLLTPRNAALFAGISYPAMKKLILGGSIQTIRTIGGHHRVSISSLRRFLHSGSAGPISAGLIITSQENRLVGQVVRISLEGLMAEVIIAVGGTEMKALITADCAREMALKCDEQVAVLVRPTDLIIARLNAFDDPPSAS